MSGEAIDAAALRRRWLTAGLGVYSAGAAADSRRAGTRCTCLAMLRSRAPSRPGHLWRSIDWRSPSPQLAGAWPGEPLIAAAIVVSLLVRGVRRAAAFIAVAALAGSINVLTKMIVASPRPTTDLVQVIQIANGSGFPSGHAFSATLLYGAVWIVLPTIVPNQMACRLARGSSFSSHWAFAGAGSGSGHIGLPTSSEASSGEWSRSRF